MASFNTALLIWVSNHEYLITFLSIAQLVWRMLARWSEVGIDIQGEENRVSDGESQGQSKFSVKNSPLNDWL